MHPTWKRHSTPLHSPLRCHRFFSSPLSYLFSLSLTLVSISCLPRRSFSFAPRLFAFFLWKCPSPPSLTPPPSSPPPFVPCLFLYLLPFPPRPPSLFLSNLHPSLLSSLLFLRFSRPSSVPVTLVFLPFSLLGLSHTSVCKQIFRRAKTEL